MAVPQAPTPISGYQASTTSITLEWDDPQLPDEITSPVIRYRIECDGLPTIFVNAATRRYIVHDLKQFMIYTFSIFAENQHGSSPAAEFPQLQPGCHKYGFV